MKIPLTAEKGIEVTAKPSSASNVVESKNELASLIASNAAHAAAAVIMRTNPQARTYALPQKGPRPERAPEPVALIAPPPPVVQRAIKPNHAPVAKNSVIALLSRDTRVTGQLLAQDEDMNDPLVYEIVALPAYGSIMLNADGSFVYSRARENGMIDFEEHTDSFTFRVTDGKGYSNTASVYVLQFLGQGRSVAVIDTGTHYDHVALNVATGFNFYTYDNDPRDENGHGTHVAGVIGSMYQDYNADGSIKTPAGIAPGADLVDLRWTNYNGTGSAIRDATEAMKWIAISTDLEAVEELLAAPGSLTQWQQSAYEAILELRYPIVSLNNSWESSSSGYMEAYLDILRDKGIFIAAGAGNGGRDGDVSPSYPASYDSVTAVMASSRTGNNVYEFGSAQALGYTSTLWGSSNRYSDGLIAPGTGIRSTSMSGGYGSKSGTSIASPYLSGAAVIVEQVLDFAGIQSSPDLIYEILRNTGYDVLANGNAYREINLRAAVDSILNVGFDDSELMSRMSQWNAFMQDWTPAGNRLGERLSAAVPASPAALVQEYIHNPKLKQRRDDEWELFFRPLHPLAK